LMNDAPNAKRPHGAHVPQCHITGSGRRQRIFFAIRVTPQRVAHGTCTGASVHPSAPVVRTGATAWLWVGVRVGLRREARGSGRACSDGSAIVARLVMMGRGVAVVVDDGGTAAALQRRAAHARHLYQPRSSFSLPVSVLESPRFLRSPRMTDMSRWNAVRRVPSSFCSLLSSESEWPRLRAGSTRSRTRCLSS